MSSTPAPTSDSPLAPCPGSTAPTLGSPLWDSVSEASNHLFSCSSVILGLALCSVALLYVPSSPCLPPAAHSSDMLQDTAVPLLSTQLCNSSCMYSGALTPRMLCAGYLDGRADACQVWQQGAQGGGWGQGSCSGLAPGLSSLSRRAETRQDSCWKQEGPEWGVCSLERPGAPPPERTNCLFLWSLCLDPSGGQWGTPGLPRWGHMAPCGGGQLGPRLRRAQAPWHLRQSC